MMTSSPDSNSEHDPRQASSAFDQLAEPVRKWIWRQDWRELRDIQEYAIPAIIGGGDVIIAAATASGKTEAAFLPLISRILAQTERPPGFAAAYVSPLKALINDQFRRLEGLCEEADIPVHKWHGDVSSSAKSRARQRPDGILLITPESLEAILVRRGLEAPRLFGALTAIVIDELHAFIGSERGIQLQSILHRIEVVARRRIDRIGLSATLGDMGLAAEALRPGHGDTVAVLESKASGGELLAQIRGYVESAPPPQIAPRANSETGPLENAGESASKTEEAKTAAKRAIASHLFGTLRGSRNLIYAGSRQSVEIYADLLRQTSEDERVPNEFHAHHGSLSKEHREFVEGEMREGNRPASAICTTTLELGIDIGDVESVAQIGPPWSVASLRQRLGRSGRRAGRPAVLRMYIPTPELNSQTHLVDRLRMDIVQSIAMLRLLIEGWCEPPKERGLHLSTLVHQVLAVIAQYGGLQPQDLFRLLSGSGPFGNISPEFFTDILRAVGHPDVALIEQAADGTLLPGRVGERIIENYRFYAVFETPEEYRIVADGKTLGAMPVTMVLYEGATIIFAGKRWRVTAIDDRVKTIEVRPAESGLPPVFGGSGGDIHDTIVKEMLAVYREHDEPAYLNPNAQELLAEGRTAFREARIANSPIQTVGEDCVLFPWVGTQKLETLMLALRRQGVDAQRQGLVIEAAKCPSDDLRGFLKTMASTPAPVGTVLASMAETLIREKFDPYLPQHILTQGFAAERIDAPAVPLMAHFLTGS